MTESTLLRTSERHHLAVVVFTDVVGYSARMQRDEAGTIAQVRADFDLMRAFCAARGGEVLNTMGDGMMLSFPSAQQGVQFALEVQGRFAPPVGAGGGADRLQHRIGIHLGDVYRLDDGHLAGDGVNIASRLESRSPPGGVCLSQTVYDTVKGKLQLNARCEGPQTFKNLHEPIVVWVVMPADRALPPPPVPVAPSAVATPVLHSKPRRLLLGGGAVAAVAALGGGAFLWSRRGAAPGGEGDGVAAVPDHSIAVLPFTNMSEDKDTAYFADGIHEDLLTQLALLRELKVVSRTSVMEYRKTAKNMRQIGTELKVGALVEGSVRRAGNQIRVTAQLIDARSDQHLWARSYDRELKDVFRVQSELATEIAQQLRVSLQPAEKTRIATASTENPEAYELLLKHQQLANRNAFGLGLRTSLKERIGLLEKAVELDPRFALAWARLAADLSRAASRELDIPSASARAEDAMDRALALAPADPLVRTEEGTYQLLGRYDLAKAGEAYASVLATAPNNVQALAGLADVRVEEARGADALAALKKARDIDARNESVLNRLAGTHQRYRQYPEAQAMRKALLAMRPEDRQLQASYHRTEYLRTGRWDDYDAWRKTLPADAASRYSGVRLADGWRAVARRDMAEVLRILPVQAENASGVTPAWDELVQRGSQALALNAFGKVDEARRIARDLLPGLQREMAKSRSRQLATVRASMLALAGQRDAAFQLLRQAADQLRQRGYVTASLRLDAGSVDLHALSNETQAALQELRRQLARPGYQVHQARVSLALAKLWDLPAFQAIVEDPASNAPLSPAAPVT